MNRATRADAHLDARRIEEAGLNSLQTQRQLFYDGWLLRLSAGKAKRARSVNAHFGSTLPLDRKIEHCESVYAQHGLAHHRQRAQLPVERLGPEPDRAIDATLHIVNGAKSVDRR